MHNLGDLKRPAATIAAVGALLISLAACSSQPATPASLAQATVEKFTQTYMDSKDVSDLFCSGSSDVTAMDDNFTDRKATAGQVKEVEASSDFTPSTEHGRYVATVNVAGKHDGSPSGIAWALTVDTTADSACIYTAEHAEATY